MVFWVLLVEIGWELLPDVKTTGQKEEARKLNALKTYQDHIEKAFLEEAKSYYSRESQSFLEQNSVNEYIRKVSKFR